LVCQLEFGLVNTIEYEIAIITEMGTEVALARKPLLKYGDADTKLVPNGM
jgi:hypothetical protein